MSIQIPTVVLDGFVLSILAEGDSYGYAITQHVLKYADVSESTLYPVLRRVKKQGLVTTYDEPTNGRNRRYYRITNEGRTKLDETRQEWIQFSENVNNLLLGGKK
ncbi:PadR family transcriptional regulator [Pediococcus claussenii]|uniref:Transcriptional regulator, PadR-like family n=1 Tax=Pediococcus claussenii (strain ATCC BAA-344 / DSM 14800 / JCM 18046 / KCTC 3811 / LMG 21948 / P06) TaxID=701521 RepID=G8PAV0_PEDCP|nr:PadR family transcriptional regulator [Pediococcus claussenii]AEV95818.1 transcriptional regulator, PadR-like family [Pediococcus claussenii ATCC BAA-344]ANZ69315.1 PadR family transcriptional regulator [Pediococcus claussenii]ANZ71135.1 PadR family transcriptional regulator [Pediococcus claussenii]KRN20425.1 hypothetical protein IV79_GL000480 [Pediococcus claussenii]